MLKILLLSIALIVIAFAGLAIRLIFVKNGTFRGGNCSATPELKDRGISCGCGNPEKCETEMVSVN